MFTTGVKETCRNLPNALIARKPVGRQNAWLVSVNKSQQTSDILEHVCLLGYRCEWCGFTSHGGCRHFVSQECTFGQLQPIYLPPHAVSIPRTEVPMEAIIGVQVKNKGAPMTREYSCRELNQTVPVRLFSFLRSSQFLKFHFLFLFRWFFGSVTVFSVKSAAELRTISLCDSDLFIQSYNANHRKFSAASNSPSVSYYSGTESQQSVSARSLYDNVVEVSSEAKDKVFKTSRFLMPPKVSLKSSLVNRSKSFQETGQCRKHLLPRKHIFLTPNLHQSSSIEHKFETISNLSSTPVGSTVFETNVDCSVPQPNETMQSYCSCDNKSNDPFFLRVLRRLQKLSHQWRKCKRVRRGRDPNQLVVDDVWLTHDCCFSSVLY